MLKVKDSKNQKSSVGSVCNNIVGIEVIQPYIANNVADCVQRGTITFKEDGVHAIEPLTFKRPNKDFIWPEEYPLHIEWDTSKFKLRLAPEDNEVNDVDIHAGDLSKQKSGNKYLFTKCIYSLWDPEGETGCESINVENGNTSNITKLDGTFLNFAHLVNLDLSTWDLSNVIYAPRAFECTAGLKSIKFNEAGMPNLTSCRSMFQESGTDDTVLDLKCLRPHLIRNADHMFYMSSAKEIDLRGGKFTYECNHNYFARDCYDLECFNGVKLDRRLLTPDEKYHHDGSRICGNILEKQGCILPPA